jgi:hypothetical protein
VALVVVHLPQRQLTIMLAVALAALRRALPVLLDLQEGPGAHPNSAFTSTAATVGVGLHYRGEMVPFQIGRYRWATKPTCYMPFCSQERPCSSGVT